MKQIGEKRVYGFDVARAVAILLVVLGHGGLAEAMRQHSFFSELAAASTFWGVELFFVLSGFLIGTILLRVGETGEGLSRQNLQHFWLSRWSRTLPAYYLILCLQLFASWYGTRTLPAHWQSYFCFSQNWTAAPPPFFVQSWSLSIEEWFYISFPLVLYTSTVWLSFRKAMSMTMLLFILASVILRSLWPIEHSWDFDLRKAVLPRFDATVYGVAAAYVARYHPEQWHALRRRYGMISVAVCLSVVGFWQRDLLSFFVAFRILFFPLTALTFAALLSHLHTVQAPAGKMSVVTRFFSNCSYAAYLTHPGLQSWYMDSAARWPLTGIFWFLKPITWFLFVWLVAWLFYLAVELPVRRIRSYFRLGSLKSLTV